MQGLGSKVLLFCCFVAFLSDMQHLIVQEELRQEIHA